MKTAKQRDEMVARVKAAVEQWPSFDSMPYSDKTLVANIEIKGNPADNRTYVDAIYELCALGATPIGRRRGNVPVIVGEGDWSDAVRSDLDKMAEPKGVVLKTRR